MVDASFHQFKEQFVNVTQSFGETIESINSTVDPLLRQDLISQAEEEEVEGKNLLDKIQRQVRHFPYHLKNSAEMELRTLKKGFELHVNDLRTIRETSGSKPLPNYSMLRNKDDVNEFKVQRKQLLATKEINDENSQSLERTMITIHETTETGTALTQELHQQREGLIRSRESLKETESLLLLRSKNTLDRMRRRLVTNNIVTYFILSIELFMN